MTGTHQQRVMELEAGLGHKIVVRLEGDLDDIGLRGDVGGGLIATPPAPDDGAGLRDVLHLHVVVPETEVRGQTQSQTSEGCPLCFPHGHDKSSSQSNAYPIQSPPAYTQLTQNHILSLITSFTSVHLTDIQSIHYRQYIYNTGYREMYTSWRQT